MGKLITVGQELKAVWSVLENKKEETSPALRLVPAPDQVTLDVLIENIPQALKALRQWVQWRNEVRDGKPTKIPYQTNGQRADSTRPATWTSFDVAWRVFLKTGWFSGIGFVFTSNDPYLGVDLDKCRNPETGEIAPWARQILDRLSSYSEISPSGTGIKIFMRGRLPRNERGETKHKKSGMGENGGAIEIYDRDRYFTLTGQRLTEYPATVEERGPEIEALHTEIFAPSTTTNSSSSKRPDPLSLSDDEIIQVARNARNGEKFSRLFAGDTGEYANDDSAADLALCATVAFYVKGDPAAIDRIFRQSGLYREKWDREDYRERTISKALEGMVEFYSPSGFKKAERLELSRLQASPQELRVEPFPIEALPACLAQFVQEASQAMPCPPDFVGVPMLAVLGMALGTSRAIQIKRGWTEGARFFVAVVADPGSRKSPALDWAVMPLRDRQRELQGMYEEALTAYRDDVSRFEAELEVWKAATRKAARQGETGSGKPEAPAEPVMAQVLTTDATLEALSVLLQQNPRGVVFLRDELTGWVNGMNQYKGGKGADRQAWLSFWNGAQVIVNRKSVRGAVILDRPFVCVAGCLPPDVLGDLADERGREDGFIHRLLFSYPERLTPYWTDAVVSQEAQDGYRKVCHGLLRLQPGVDDHGRSTPVVVSFSDEGRATFIEWVNSHHQELSDPLFPENLQGPWAKLEGYCARVALVIQEARYVSGEAEGEAIDAISVEGAAALMDYFKSHARKVYSQLHVTREDKQAELALAWIQKQGGKVTARELLHNHVAGVRTQGEALQLLKGLEERGRGKVEEKEKKSYSFTITI